MPGFALNAAHRPLLDALEADDAQGLQGYVRRLLDGGDMGPIRAAVQVVGSRSPEAASQLEQMLLTEAQQGVYLDAEVALFAVPILVDPRLPFRYAEVAEVLDLFAAPAEHFMLLGNWVRPEALLGMEATDYRAFVEHLALAALDAAADPMRPGMPQRMLETCVADGAVLHTPERPDGRLAVRVVVGAALRPRGTPVEPGGLFDYFVGANLPPEALASLEFALAEVLDYGVTVLDPGLPLECAWQGLGMLATLILRARLDGAQMQIGVKPITHFCLFGSNLHLAMTRDGSAVLDRVTLCTHGLDVDLVIDTVTGRSRAMVQHGSPFEPPFDAPPPRLH